MFVRLMTDEGLASLDPKLIKCVCIEPDDDQLIRVKMRDGQWFTAIETTVGEVTDKIDAALSKILPLVELEDELGSCSIDPRIVKSIWNLDEGVQMQLTDGQTFNVNGTAKEVTAKVNAALMGISQPESDDKESTNGRTLEV